MGGWRADGSAAASPHKEPSPARSRRGESRGPRSSFGARRDLSVRWRDAMRPVKDAAALGRNGANALRDATLRFFADAEARGFPSTADMDAEEAKSDVLTLARAANGAAELDASASSTDLAEAAPTQSGLARGVDALVADLVAADTAALDDEVVAVLCAYYVSRLSRRDARARTDAAAAGENVPSAADENDAANAYRAVAALAQAVGASFPDAETEALTELAIGDLRAFTRQDSRRHVLGALGAVASRVPASALSARAHARVGEALSRLLDELDAASRPFDRRASASASREAGSVLEETAVASRYYASLWRCAHLCASRDGTRWPEPVVASLAGRVRRFLSFGVGADAALAEASASSSDRGYVPPHARDADAVSDSDASDAEASAREKAYGDRFGSSRVRANAAAFAASLARADPRAAHPFWPRLLPTSTAQYSRVARAPCTLARAMLHDPSPRVRAAAAATVAQLLDAPASRQYLSAAEIKLDPKTGLAARRVNFVSLSSTLGDLAVATHGALTLAIRTEQSPACVLSVCKALAALADAAPFARLPLNLLPDSALAAWRRVSGLTRTHATRASEDPEGVSATVALLSALSATLGAQGAPARFRAALGGEDAARDPGNGSFASSGSALADARDLREIIPGLASLAGDATLAVAVRCEAFSALRAAAATHAAAVAAHWRDARVQAALPFRNSAAPAPSGAEKRLLSGDEKDRAAHASARFLAEFLVAAGGGGAAAALTASAGDEASNVVAPGDDEAAAARRRRGAGVVAAAEKHQPRAFALPAEASVALWTSVASEHFPAMMAHASPLVRATGVGALGGLTAEALRGVSEAHRSLLTYTPRALARSDDSAAVRAAACRAVGASASFYARDASGRAAFLGPASEGFDPETRVSLRADAELLVAAMRDGAKSVRLPASWAVANVCGAAASAREGDERAAADNDATLSLLAEACVDAATKEGDKVRANAARALGHVLAAADLSRGEGRVAARLHDITQALMSCLATGNAKTQWNACRAVRELYANATARESASRDAWSPSALRMCLMLVRDARNFKLRAHAAATLAAPPGREAFGNAYADVLSVVASAAEQTTTAAATAPSPAPPSPSRTVPSDGGDPDAPRHASRLAARLAATLLRVAALGRAEDAASVRDTLVKKRATLRRVASETRRALEEVAARERAREDALPEDPFGTGRSAEKKRRETGNDAAHDDVAVGVPRGASIANASEARVEANRSASESDEGFASPEGAKASMDVSALAEVLSPAKSESARESSPGCPREGDARPTSEVAAAAAGLRQMYAALGGEANDAEAAFYERFARA